MHPNNLLKPLRDKPNRTELTLMENAHKESTQPRFH
jgi:hypothetical protein